MQLPPGVEEIGTGKRSSLPEGIEPIREEGLTLKPEQYQPPVVEPTRTATTPSIRSTSTTQGRPTPYSSLSDDPTPSFLTRLGGMLDTVANPKTLSDIGNLLAPDVSDELIRMGMRYFRSLRNTQPAAEVLKGGSKFEDYKIPEFDPNNPADRALQRVHDDIPVDEQGRKIYNPAGKMEFDIELKPNEKVSTKINEPPRFSGFQNSGNGILYAQFDRAGTPVTAEQVKSMFPGKNISVTKFSQNILSPHLQKFRIDVFDENGRISSKAAKELENSIGGQFWDWQRAGEEMYNKVNPPSSKPPVNKEGIYSSPALKPKAGDPSVPDKIDPVQKMKDALKTARPIRAEQEALYTAEKGKRINEAASSTKQGEEWAKEYMGALKGEYPKVEYDGVKFEQSDVDNLFSQVKTSTRLNDWERPRAITGLGKILDGSAVPQDNEITVLRRVFGDDLQKPLTRINMISEALSVPRAMQSAFDLSAPMRQGLGLIHKKAWWTSWDDMIKSAGSEKFYQNLQEGLRSTPHYELGQRNGLALTDLLSAREEQIMSNIVEKVPVIGRGVRASNRAYTGFLNKLRSDVFNDLIDKSIKAGLDPRKDETIAADIAQFINNATGRGDLGQLEKYAKGLNNTFFSPRFIASRVNMVRSVVPYIGAPKSVRKEYLKSLAAIATAGTTLTNLARLAGAKIESDPASSDFGKAKIGNTRFDPYGGFQQYLTLFSRIKPEGMSIPGLNQTDTGTPLDQITGFLSSPGNRFKSSTAKPSSRFADYGLGTQFGGSTRKDVIEDFGVNKLAPIPRFVYQLLDQSKDRPFNVPAESVKMFIPMVIQDLYEVSQEDPELLPLTLPASVVGIGAQSYGGR